jgi:hypothetical protein
LIDNTGIVNDDNNQGITQNKIDDNKYTSSLINKRNENDPRSKGLNKKAKLDEINIKIIDENDHTIDRIKCIDSNEYIIFDNEKEKDDNVKFLMKLNDSNDKDKKEEN